MKDSRIPLAAMKRLEIGEAIMGETNQPLLSFELNGSPLPTIAGGFQKFQMEFNKLVLFPSNQTSLYAKKNGSTKAPKIQHQKNTVRSVSSR